LHDQDSDARWQNSRQYRTLRLDPMSKSTAGKLFEPAFHALCVKGASFQLRPMVLKPGGRTLDTYTNSEPASEDLTLPPRQRVAFDKQNPIATLAADRYYQPRHGTQPTYDSFIFYPEDPRFVLFQVTEGVTHGVKPKGINDLLELAQQLGIANPVIQFIVVVPEGLAVECSVPKHNKFWLDMCCIEVTESQLYD